MKHRSRFLMIVFALTLIFSGIAGAQDKPKTGVVDLKILPPAVLNAFKTAYPHAVITGAAKETENNVTVYEVESVDGQINRDLLYTADGKATEIEESTASENLPAPVKQTLAKDYPGAKVLKAEILTKAGVKSFELSLQVKDKTMGVTINPQGKIMEKAGEEVEAKEKEEEEKEKDEEKEEEEDAPGYHLLNKIVIGGEGGWDYLALEPGSRLLYVSHGNVFEVVNVDTGAKFESIPDLKGVHGVAFAPDRGRGYISNGRGNSVSVFDLKTRKVMEEISIAPGQNPDSIMYDAASGRVFTFNGRTANATAIDAATNKVVGTVEIGGKPEFAVTDGQGLVFVNNEDKSEIVSFDAKTLEVKKRWSIAPGEGPSGLAVDLKNKRLFSVCDKVLVVSDFEAGKVVATVEIGPGPDAVRYDPGTGLVFASCGGDGTLAVVRQESADKYSLIETVPTARGGRTMELDLKTHNVFVTCAEYGPAPAPTKEQPRPRPTVVPNSFKVLVLGK